MEDKDKFYGDVLIKLQRKYGKNELIASLNKEISAKDIELGQLKSYIDELEYRIKGIENKHKMELGNLLSSPNKLVDSHGFTYVKLKTFEQLKKDNKDQKRKILELRKSNSELISKIPR